MVCFRFIFILVSVILNLSDGVKVDLKASLSLGKEVVNVLKSYVNKNSLNGRRSFGGGEDVASGRETDKDTISLIVHSSFLCRNVEFVQDELCTFLNQYIILLAKEIENALKGLVNDTNKTNNTRKTAIFEGELKQLVRKTKKILREVNQKITDKNESYMWIDLLKRINAKFQETATTFAVQRLEGNAVEVTDVRKKLAQEQTIAATLIELKFLDKLCYQHKICSKSHEISKALNSLLVTINTLPEDRAKEFVRLFYETLPSTNFYYRISDVTGHEFQTILHDMAYADNVTAKNVLGIIQRIVEKRLNAVNNEEVNEETVGEEARRDVKLVHVMLSDMDHFYSKNKKEPFYEFLNDFFEWTKAGGKFNSQLRRVMMDLQNGLSFESDELVLKLVNEMRVFMEITVDPES